MKRTPRAPVGIERRRDDGAVAVLVAIMVSLLLVLTAVAVDAARWYVEAARIQKVADAAALAGVSKLTNNSDDAFNEATGAATVIAASNGYVIGDNFTLNGLTTPKSTTQFGVSVSSTVPNVFGRIFGRNETTITRIAFADYLGDALIASPCNTFGNEPSGSSAQGPSTTTIPNTSSQGGYATCQGGTPGFWAGIEGPQTQKTQGDRFNTTVCRGTDRTDYVYACSTAAGAGSNLEYSSDTVGNFFLLRVGPGAVGKRVYVQAFDPAYVEVGSGCDDYDWDPSSNMNPFATDSSTRYEPGDTPYCTGDSDPRTGATDPSGQTAMTTSFVVRGKTDTLNPRLAPVISGCVKQFGSFTSAPDEAELDDSESDYDIGLAKVWRQWYPLCDFTPSEEGDYYIQVRTNASTTGGATVAQTSGLVTENGPNAYADSETTTEGRGSNGFGLRAYVGSPDCTTQPCAFSNAVSVAGYQRLSMLQNDNLPSGNTFNLIQVKPNAASKTIGFELFDAGDGSAGRMTVLPPSDAESTGVTLVNCKWRKVDLTNYSPMSTGCYLDIASGSGNGTLYAFDIPVPSNYTCKESSPGGCWFRVRFAWENQPTDFTTWSARIKGDTIRLVQ